MAKKSKKSKNTSSKKIKSTIKEELNDLGMGDFLAKEELIMDELKKELGNVEEFVKKHPIMSVCIALAVGYYIRKIVE